MELSELGRRAEALYQRFRLQLETEENIGKIVVFDVDSGDYELDTTGIESSRRLRERHPVANLYALRIGYKQNRCELKIEFIEQGKVSVTKMEEIKQ